MAYTDDDEAIKIVIGMLSPAVAAETASFTFDSSVCLAHHLAHPDQPQTTCHYIQTAQSHSPAPQARGLDHDHALLACPPILACHFTDLNACSSSSTRRPCEVAPTPRPRPACGSTTSAS